MKYRKSGDTGLIVSEVALGTMQFGGKLNMGNLGQEETTRSALPDHENSNNRAAVGRVASALHLRRDEIIGRDPFGLLRSCLAFRANTQRSGHEPASVDRTAHCWGVRIGIVDLTALGRSTCRARRISESVALRVLYSNCALSPAPQRACRSGRDSQLFSCGGGTSHTRDDSSSQ
jgi:hypothetical protein